MRDVELYASFTAAFYFVFFNDPATTEIYTLSLHDALPISLQIAKRLAEMGFSLVATIGTAKLLQRQGMTVEVVHKVNENYRPNIVDLMKRGEIALVFNTPEDGRARRDSYLIRRSAVTLNVPYYTTV